MAFNAPQVRIAQTGALYLAPYGTAAPVDTATALTTPWAQLGYASEKGADITFDVKFGDIKSWQSLVVLRKYVTDQGLSIAVELEQTNSDVLSAYFAGAAAVTNPNETGGKVLNVSNTPGVDERAAVLEFFDGTVKYRIYVPRCLVTDRGKTTASRGGATIWPITIEALAVDQNTPIASLIFKDSNFS